MISGIGEPGEWNGQHFRSPSVLDFGDYLLVAMEGWTGDDAPTGLGLMIGVERWLRAMETDLVVSDNPSSPTEVMLGNYGAGELTINQITVLGEGFRIRTPSTPIKLKPAEELIIPVSYDGMNTFSQGLIVVKSNSQIDEMLSISLKTP